jgi:putative tricarboxylic transport membrane protein
LLPLTFKVPATAIFVLFAGIYYGAMYGGSTTSILLNTPGESATIVTSLEGNKMARPEELGQLLPRQQLVALWQERLALLR